MGKFKNASWSTMFVVDATTTEKGLKKQYKSLIKEYNKKSYPEEYAEIQNAYEYALRYVTGSTGSVDNTSSSYENTYKPESSTASYESSNESTSSNDNQTLSEKSYENKLQYIKEEYTKQNGEKSLSEIAKEYNEKVEYQSSNTSSTNSAKDFGKYANGGKPRMNRSNRSRLPAIIIFIIIMIARFVNSFSGTTPNEIEERAEEIREQMTISQDSTTVNYGATDSRYYMCFPMSDIKMSLKEVEENDAGEVSMVLSVEGSDLGSIRSMLYIGEDLLENVVVGDIVETIEEGSVVVEFTYKIEPSNIEDIIYKSPDGFENSCFVLSE